MRSEFLYDAENYCRRKRHWGGLDAFELVLQFEALELVAGGAPCRELASLLHGESWPFVHPGWVERGRDGRDPIMYGYAVLHAAYTADVWNSWRATVALCVLMAHSEEFAEYVWDTTEQWRCNAERCRDE